MRSITFLSVLLCACSMLSAADPQKFSPAEQEVLNAMNVRVEADAKHDGSLARYIADDCIFSDDMGRVFTKAQFLDDKLPPPSTTRSETGATSLSTYTEMRQC